MRCPRIVRSLGWLWIAVVVGMSLGACRYRADPPCTFYVAPRPIYRYTVESPRLPMSELRSLHDRIIVQALSTVRGVSKITSCGASPNRVEIQVNPQRLSTLGLTVAELAKGFAGAAERAILPAGPRTTTDQLPFSFSDLSSLAIAKRQGAPVRLRDVASLEVLAAPLECLAGHDDRQAVLLGEVYLYADTDRRRARANLRTRLAQLRTTLPPDVRVDDFTSAPRSQQTPTRQVEWVKLSLPADLQPQAMQSLASALRERARQHPEVASVLTQASLVPTGMSGGSVVELELFVELRADPMALRTTPVAEELIAELRKLPAIEAVRGKEIPLHLKLHAQVNDFAATLREVALDDVRLTLAVALGEQRLGRLRDGAEGIDLVLRSTGERELPAAIEGFMVKGRDGALVPLPKLLRLTEETVGSRAVGIFTWMSRFDD